MLLGDYLNFCSKCSDSEKQEEGNAKGFIRHEDAKLVLHELLFRKRGLSAVNGTTRTLSQEGKRS